MKKIYINKITGAEAEKLVKEAMNKGSKHHEVYGICRMSLSQWRRNLQKPGVDSCLKILMMLQDAGVEARIVMGNK